jgi:hypothetical protein
VSVPIADIVERMIAVGNEHTDPADPNAGTEFLAQRLDVELDELDDAATDIAKRMVPVVIQRPPLTRLLLQAAIASAVVEGFFFGVEYERERSKAYVETDPERAQADHELHDPDQPNRNGGKT